MSMFLLLLLFLASSVKLTILCNCGIACLTLVFTFFNKYDAFSKLFIWVFKYQCWRAFVLFFTLVAIVSDKPFLIKPANAGQEQLWASKVALFLLFICYSSNSVTARPAQLFFSHVFSNH